MRQQQLTSRDLERQAEDLLEDAWRARTSEPDRTRERARRLVALVEGAGAATESLRGFSEYAQLLLGVGGLEEELAHGQRALEAFERARSQVWEVRILLDLSAREGRKGRLTEAEALLRRGLAGARKHGLAEIEPSFLYNLGLFQVRTGDLARGLEVYQQARRAFRRVGRSAGEGAVLVGMGSAYRMLGSYPEALDALIEGIELLELAGERTHRVTGLCVLAGVYSQLGIADRAIRHAEQARELTAADSPDGARSWYALAQAHREAGNAKAARDAAERSLSIAERLGRPFLRLDPMVELAELDRQAGRLDEAEARYREGMAVVESMDVPDLELTLQLGLAGVLEARGQLDEACALAEGGTAQAEKIGERHTRIQLYELLGRLAEGRGDAGTALDYLKRAQELRADVFSRETDIRVRNIQVAHELRRERAQSAEVLRQLSRKVMDSQEAERSRLARELHDDLGQRLALLAVELDLLAGDPPASADDVRERAGSLSDAARAIADDVSAMSHRLHPAVLEQLGLVDAVRSLCRDMTDAFACAVEFRAENVPETVPNDVALCLYRIVQEGLRNAVRHGQARRASVVLLHRDGELGLHLADEGRGFDPQALEKPGLGLAGMRERVQHLRGSFELRSAPGEGATIEVRLPLSSAEPAS